MRLTNERAQHEPDAAAAGDRARRWDRPMAWVAAAGASLAIYLFYLASYPIRHLALPPGFDPPFYVWRTQYLASEGLGHGATAARPGYQILSALLGSLTGRSQLQVVVVLSLVLVAVLALAVGAFAWEGVGAGRWRWLIVIAVTGAVLGPTHLVGENLSNLLNLALVVAGLVALIRAGRGDRGLWPAVALLVASGLAHWDFLAVITLILAGAFVLSLVAPGVPWVRGPRPMVREARLVAVVLVAVVAIMLVLIAWVLRAPFKTVEVTQDALLYARRFKTDLVRLIVPLMAGVLAVPILAWLRRDDRKEKGRLALILLGAWTVVTVAGVIFGAVSSRLPAARLLALLVALPGAVAAGSVLAFLVDRLGGRRRPGAPARRTAAICLAVLAVGALAVPAALRWYRYPVLMRVDALQQAETAGRYVRTLPPHTPVIFLVQYPRGTIGPYETVVDERTIRIAMPPSRELDVYLFVGEVADLLAGRRTAPPDERSDRITLPYWTDVRTVLPAMPPVVILQSMGGPQFQESQGAVIGPCVRLLRGPTPSRSFPSAPAPNAVPSLAAGLGWGLLLLALMGVAGVGWTRVFLGPSVSPEVFASLTPAVGAGVLILGGLVAAKLSVRLGGAGGVATYLVIAALGLAAAAFEARSRSR